MIAGGLLACARERDLRTAVLKPIELGCSLVTSPSHDLPAQAPAASPNAAPLPPSAVRVKRPGPTVPGLPRPPSPEEHGARARLDTLAGPLPWALTASTPPELLHPADAYRLMSIAGMPETSLPLVNPYRFQPALEPAVAARLAGVTIDPSHIQRCVTTLAATADLLVLEGTSGPLDPLAPGLLFADLLAELGATALVVAPSEPGTTSQVLCCIESLGRRNIPLAGVVLNRLHGPLRPEEAALPEQLESCLGPLVRGVLPYLSPEELADDEAFGRRFSCHLDVEAILSSLRGNDLQDSNKKLDP